MTSKLTWSQWKVYFCCLIIRLVQCEILHTKLGSLQGGERMSRSGVPYLYWSRIPYAKPPIGNLRLAAPVPAGKWEDVLNATLPMPLCPQVPLFVLSLPRQGQEDCLYLAVHKPKHTSKKSLPVLLYVHGGAFFFGHPGPIWFNDYIMDEEIILVTITYRVGYLGFMSLNDPELPGNFGIKDQIAAVNWVYDNIEDYGGDPKQITVFGESAGSVGAHYMLVLPSVRDKVSKAFLMSGTINKSWSQIPMAVIQNFTEELVSRLSCTRDTAKECLDCLRNIKDASTILEAAMSFLPLPTEFIVMGPTIEPPNPTAAITEDFTGVTTTKPIVASFAAGEFLLSELPNVVKNYTRVQEIHDDLNGYSQFILRDRIDDSRLVEQARRVKERYMIHDDLPGLGHDIGMVFQDLTFTYPLFNLLERHPGPKWTYNLVHRGEISILEYANDLPPMPDLSPIAAHADELVILFDRRHDYQYAQPKPFPNDVRISKEFIKYLVNFATYGNPTPDGSPLIWKPYTGSEILQIKTEGTSHAPSGFAAVQKEIMEFWRTVYL